MISMIHYSSATSPFHYCYNINRVDDVNPVFVMEDLCHDKSTEKEIKRVIEEIQAEEPSIAEMPIIFKKRDHTYHYIHNSPENTCIKSLCPTPLYEEELAVRVIRHQTGNHLSAIVRNVSIPPGLFQSAKLMLHFSWPDCEEIDGEICLHSLPFWDQQTGGVMCKKMTPQEYCRKEIKKMIERAVSFHSEWSALAPLKYEIQFFFQ